MEKKGNKLPAVTALQIQRTNKKGMILQVGDQLIFDHILTVHGAIAYNPAVGVVELNETGIFFVQWNVLIMSSEDKCVGFTLHSSQGDMIRSNSLNRQGEVLGSGIIVASNPGVTLSLIHDSTVTSLSILPVQANMVVYSVGNSF